MTKKLYQAVEDYNSTYNTSFEVLSIFSFGQAEGNPLSDNLNPYSNKGGVSLFLDQDKNVMAVYSANDLYTSLRLRLKKHTSGDWVFNGQEWNAKPAYVAFVTGDQDKMYKKESLRYYLIEKLHSRLYESGIYV